MKNFLKRLTSTIAFLLILCVSVHLISDLFAERGNSFVPEEYYEYDKDTFDVVFLGPSTVRNAIYPMELWKQYGIVSYNLGSASQSVPQSYYLAKMAIERDHPSAIVVDMGLVSQKTLITDTPFLHYTTDTMPITSREKWEMIRYLNPEEAVQYLFTLDIYHTRWKELTETALKEDFRDLAYGAVVSGVRISAPLYEDFEIDTSYEIDGKVLGYIDRLIELCDENDTDLIFVSLPTIGTGYQYLPQKDYEMRANAAAALSRYISSTGVPHLDYFTRGEELGLDPETDSYDGHHLNALGAEKVTDWMGEYLVRTCGLEDHREDPEYAFMDEDYITYRAHYWRTFLRRNYSLRQYFGYLEEAQEEEDYLILLSVGGSQKTEVTDEQARIIMQSGAQQSLSGYGEYSYLAVIDGGEIVYESDARSRQTSETYHVQIGSFRIEMESHVDTSSTASLIRIDDTNYAAAETGLNVVVVDKNSGVVVDSASFTLDGKFTCTHRTTL